MEITQETTPKLIGLGQWATAHGINRFTAAKWARTGRIAGATKAGKDWLIPDGSPVPAHGKPGNPRWIANKGKAAAAREAEALHDEPANAW